MTDLEQIESRLGRIEAMLERKLIPEFLTISECAVIFHCSTKKIRRMINSGDIPFSRLGNSEKSTILIRYADIKK